MRRGLPAGFKNVLKQDIVYPALLAQFEFDNGTTRIWSGETDLTANLGEGSQTWTGGGALAGVKTSGEGDNISSRNLTFTLNGVDQAFYNTALSTQYRGRPAKLWFAVFNVSRTAIAYYYLLEEARMDSLSISEADDGNITLQLDCESRLVDLFKANRVFLSNVDHHKYYPEDDFYRFTGTLEGQKLPWGMKADRG